MDSLSVSEAARRLGVSTATVRRLIRARELRAWKKTLTAPNSHYVIVRESVDAYLAARQKQQG